MRTPCDLLMRGTKGPSGSIRRWEFLDRINYH